jgi:DNA-binding transcriptional regulator YiaG
MSGRDYEILIEQLGMTQAGSARFVGFSERTARRWIAGDAEVPPSVVLLLNSLVMMREQPRVPIWEPGQN